MMLKTEKRKVKNSYYDGLNNVTYLVMAYREMSDDELLAMQDAYLRRSPRPEKNSTVIIQSRLGIHD